ncbi:MAG TPA: hypothetical protein VIF09_15100 [Polyangiaceae bacterium]
MGDAGHGGDGGHGGDAGSPGDAGATDGPSSTLDGAAPVGSDLCIEDGWCWERPSFFGVEMTGVWGSSFSDVWAVGRGGTILHFDGTSWTRLPPITPEPLYDVHGSGPKDVWAVGRHVVLHWDGTAWTSMNAPATKGWLHTVFAVAPGDAWFGGDWQALMHWDGKQFTLTEQNVVASYRALVGFASNDVWAVGDSATVQHFDGTSWTLTGADFTGFPSCTSAWGSSSKDVYLACGADGADSVQHWDGAAWKSVAFPSSVQVGPQIVAGSSSSDVWLFSNEWNCARWDGSAWTRQTPIEGEQLADAWLDPASGKGFAVGMGGRLLRRDATTTWTAASGLHADAYDELGGVFALTDDDAWAVGSQKVLRYSGQTWQSVASATTTNAQEFNGVWASGPDDAWITAWGDFPNSLQRWNGSAFSVVTGRPDGEGFLDDVWGTSANDVWIVANDGTIVHWDGSALTMLLEGLGTVGGGTGAVHGTGPSDVWMTGDGLHHWDGHSLSAVTGLPALPQGASLAAVHAIAADDVWVTASLGGVYRWNGTTWTTPPVPPLRQDDNGNLQLSGFAGTSSSDLWAIGTDGDVFHFDGSAWKRSMTAGTGLAPLARTPGGQIIAVGSSGAILRRH